MIPIICSNDAGIVLSTIAKYLDGGEKIIKDLVLVEKNDNQIVFLIDDQPIQKDAAQIWWSGYSAGLKATL